MRKILSLHLKKFKRNGFTLYDIHMLKSTKRKELKSKDHPMLWESKDVFLEKVPGLPPKRDLDFSIDMVPGIVPTSMVSYKMSTPK
jgi:hypothetical protein